MTSETSQVDARDDARSQILRPALTMLLPLVLILSVAFERVTAQDAAAPPAHVRKFISREDSFEIRYPAAFLSCKKNTRVQACLTYLPICDDTATVCVAYPPARYSGYNFEGAAFSVSQQADAETEKKCVGVLTQPIRTESINGVQFQGDTEGDAGMGHEMVIHRYRTFHDGKCYELNLRIATSSMGAYAPGAIKEFTEKDEKQVRRSLDEIKSTFTFLK